MSGEWAGEDDAHPRRGIEGRPLGFLAPGRAARCWVVSLLAAWLAIGSHGTANARGGGITGESTSCFRCHGGGSSPSVVISGPTSLTGGETASFTLTVTGGAGGVCGLDVSADIGDLAATDAVGTKLLNGEVTHQSPRAFSAGSCSFDFDWTAPLLSIDATARLSGAGMSADDDGGAGGDRAATTSLDVSVVGSTTVEFVLLGQPIDLVGQAVELSYDFGNGSGSLTATVGDGSEFVLEGAPSIPDLSIATIDIGADTITLTHSRGTRLGPGLPVISDDFLTFSFPSLPGAIERVLETEDPMPEWFDGLDFASTSVTLTQERDNAGVNTSLKTWSIALTEIELRGVAELLASDGGPGDEFGGAVAVDGDIALIGARTDDDGENSGAVYVFRHVGTRWVEETKLTASDAAANDSFGDSVAISGSTAVVGAPSSGGVGAAYVFRYDGTKWVEEKRLTASDGSANDLFGSAVAVDGDTAVVGAPGDDDDANASGSAYVFRFDGMDWLEEPKLTASDAASSDQFGSAAAVDGDTILIAGSRSAVYVLRYDGMAWVEEDQLLGGGRPFIVSVALEGDTAAVGLGADFSLGEEGVHVFRYDGATWVAEDTLTGPETREGFGASIAIEGESIWTTGGDSAYLFFYNGTKWVQQAEVRATLPGIFGGFGGAVAVDDSNVLLGAIFGDENGASSGSAYVLSVPEPSAAWQLIGAVAVLAGLARRGRRELLP